LDLDSASHQDQAVHKRKFEPDLERNARVSRRYDRRCGPGTGQLNHSIANFIDGSGIGNTGCCGTNGFNGGGVAVDGQSTPHHLYAADLFNSRVLAWNDVSSFQSGAPADKVFGQPDFFSHLCNLGVNNGVLPPTNTPTADTLCRPVVGVFVDNSSNLWVVDDGNQRVLEYLNPYAPGGGTPGTPGAAGDATADLVLGQGDFTRAGARCFMIALRRDSRRSVSKPMCGPPLGRRSGPLQ
jgi:hypothetical protein